MKWLSSLMSGILIVCAVLVTSAVVRREFFPPKIPSREPRMIDGWEKLAAGAHVSGRAGAPVKIVEFSDFECPFCGRVQPSIRAIQAEYPDSVALTFRHLPLEAIHPSAMEAALAAECAGEQSRFEEVADLLFAHQESLATIPFDEFARRAGVVNLEKFSECLATRRLQPVVENDIQLARSIGLDATPSIIVNGLLLPGTPTRPGLDSVVRRALDSGR